MGITYQVQQHNQQGTEPNQEGLGGELMRTTLFVLSITGILPMALADLLIKILLG